LADYKLWLNLIITLPPDARRFHAVCLLIDASRSTQGLLALISANICDSWSPFVNTQIMNQNLQNLLTKALRALGSVARAALALVETTAIL